MRRATTWVRLKCARTATDPRTWRHRRTPPGCGSALWADQLVAHCAGVLDDSLGRFLDPENLAPVVVAILPISRRERGEERTLVGVVDMRVLIGSSTKRDTIAVSSPRRNAATQLGSAARRSGPLLVSHPGPQPGRRAAHAGGAAVTNSRARPAVSRAGPHLAARACAAVRCPPRRDPWGSVVAAGRTDSVPTGRPVSRARPR